MKGADIVVVPSRYETLGIVVLEAMAAGKPVIASRVGGIPEVAKHGVNGILTYPSSNQVAMAVKTFCEGRQLIEEYGKNNQKAIASFDWKKIGKSYAQLYASVIDNHDVRGS